jgi:hypothetical protein
VIMIPRYCPVRPIMNFQAHVVTMRRPQHASQALICNFKLLGVTGSGEIARDDEMSLVVPLELRKENVKVRQRLRRMPQNSGKERPRFPEFYTRSVGSFV